MGLIYSTKIVCDKCGKEGFSWDCAMAKLTAINTAREKGWEFGASGFRCPKCRNQAKSSLGNQINN